MRSRQLPCQICETLVNIRSTIKGGESKGKKVCPVCKSKNSGKSKTSTRLRSVTPKTAAKNKDRSAIRKVFFDHHIELCERSEESGTPIPYPNRSNICHIFSKSNHLSIQADLDNCVYLTLSEHTRFDGFLFKLDFIRLEKEFPNCWETVCERAAILAERCTERTSFKSKIIEYLITKEFIIDKSL